MSRETLYSEEYILGILKTIKTRMWLSDITLKKSIKVSLLIDSKGRFHGRVKNPGSIRRFSTIPDLFAYLQRRNVLGLLEKHIMLIQLQKF